VEVVCREGGEGSTSMTNTVDTAHSPLVSIAMPVYNGAKTLRPAVRSLQHQAYRNWELILIDDGSADATVSIARDCRDERVVILADGERRGHGSRLNQAIDMARGKYVARMDQDDISFPQRLVKQVEWLEANPEIDLLGTAALVFNDEGAIKGLFPFDKSHAGICSRPWGGFYLPHPSWMGRIEWFKEYRYGGAEVFRAEDQDLLLRSYRSSTFACLPEILFGYRQNELPIASVLAGRRSFRRAVVREALRNGQYGHIPLVYIEQALKGAAERIIVTLGLEPYLLRHRAKPVMDVDLQRRWQEVWSCCYEERE